MSSGSTIRMQPNVNCLVKAGQILTIPGCTYTLPAPPSKTTAFTVGDITLKVYPNPTRSVTNLIYELPERQHVNLTVYDLSGKTVQRLVNEAQDAGIYHFDWNVERLNPGTYIVRMIVGEAVRYERIIVSE